MTGFDLKPLPMEEAGAFWRDKVLLSPGQFARLSDEAKLHAFAVSGIAKGGELTSVFQAIQKAIDQGTSFTEFQKDVAGVIERRGWTGKRAWRVDNIFRTNIQTAYNVGRYKQMQETKSHRPYWRYSAINDSRTRPAHLALNGKVFPADNSFWETWYPPNGYRCRCGVVSLSQEYVDRKGVTVERDDPSGKLIEPIDPQTGGRMPARLLMPDPGWSFNPGKSVWGGVVDAADRPGKWDALPGLKTAAANRRPALTNVRPSEIADLNESALLASGQGNAFYQEAFLSRYGAEKVVKDVLGEPVILSLRSFLVDKTPGATAVWKFDKAGHGASIPLMEDILLEPYEVWLTPQRNEHGRIRLSKRYIGMWKTKDKQRIGGLAVYEVVDGVLLGVTHFTPLKGRSGKTDLDYLETQRMGLLLYGKGR